MPFHRAHNKTREGSPAGSRRRGEHHQYNEARQWQPQQQSPQKNNGNDTSATHSDSSFDNYNQDLNVHHGTAQARRPKAQLHHSEETTLAGAGAFQGHSRIAPPSLVPYQSRQQHRGKSSQELDDILLMDTVALAKKDRQLHKQHSHNHSHGRSSQSRKSNRSKSKSSSGGSANSQYKHLKNIMPLKNHMDNDHGCDWRTHDSDVDSEFLVTSVSKMTLSSAGALSSSVVGLSLLSIAPPNDQWANPPSLMVRESLARHMQLCVSRCPSRQNTSLPIDVDDVSFVKTNPESVKEVAMQFIAEGEHDKALEIYRVLLRNQRQQRLDESEIAKTKSKLATLCLLMGRTDAALKFTSDALRTHQKSSRPVHMTISTMELGLAQVGAEELDQALKSWREALQLACMTLGYEHFQVAVLLNNIGCLHYYIGNLSSSVRALKESLGLQRQMLSSTSHAVSVEIPLIQIAITMGNLAMISAECRSFDTAVNLLEEATSVQESVLNDNDASQIAMKQYLDVFHKLTGETEAQKNVPPEESDEHNAPNTRTKGSGTSQSSNSTSSLLRNAVSIFGDSDGIPRRRGEISRSDQHQYDDDDHIFDFILLGSLVKQISPRQRVHYTMISSLESVLQNQYAQDMLDDASVTSSLFARKKRSIPVDLDGEAVIDAELYLEEINLQALDHLYRNEIRDALDLFESSLRSHRKKFGDIHHLVGTGLHNSGIVHMVAQNYAQAKLCFQEAISIRAAALGDSHPEVAASMFKLGMVHMACDDLHNALSIFRTIVSQLQKDRAIIGYSSEAKMLNNIGIVQFEMGREDEAHESILKGFEIQKSIFKSSQSSLAERAAANGLGNLGFIYAKQAKYNDALPVFRETLEILTKYVPLDHPLVVTVEENIAMVKAYGGVDLEERRMAGQSNPFACVQSNDGLLQNGSPEHSKITACVSLQ